MSLPSSESGPSRQILHCFSSVSASGIVLCERWEHSRTYNKYMPVLGRRGRMRDEARDERESR